MSLEKRVAKFSSSDQWVLTHPWGTYLHGENLLATLGETLAKFISLKVAVTPSGAPMGTLSSVESGSYPLGDTHGQIIIFFPRNVGATPLGATVALEKLLVTLGGIQGQDYVHQKK